jgi:hypothetical protein
MNGQQIACTGHVTLADDASRYMFSGAYSKMIQLRFYSNPPNAFIFPTNFWVFIPFWYSTGQRENNCCIYSPGFSTLDPESMKGLGPSTVQAILLSLRNKLILNYCNYPGYILCFFSVVQKPFDYSWEKNTNMGSRYFALFFSLFTIWLD